MTCTKKRCIRTPSLTVSRNSSTVIFLQALAIFHSSVSSVTCARQMSDLVVLSFVTSRTNWHQTNQILKPRGQTTKSKSFRHLRK